MGADGLDVTRGRELGEAVAEVAHAGDDEFLGRNLHQRVSNGVVASVREGNYICRGHVRGRSDPFYREADFFDGIDEGADIARDVVEEVDGGHRCVKVGAENWCRELVQRIGAENWLV